MTYALGHVCEGCHIGGVHPLPAKGPFKFRE